MLIYLVTIGRIFAVFGFGKGEKNYQGCQLKTVTTGVGDTIGVVRSTLNCPGNGNNLESAKFNKSSSGNNVEDMARDDLRRIAVKEACGPCVLARMTKLQYLDVQNQETQGQIDLLKRQAELTELKKQQTAAIEAATREVNEINNRGLGAAAANVAVDPTDVPRFDS
jgi:hypothetical protein